MLTPSVHRALCALLLAAACAACGGGEDDAPELEGEQRAPLVDCRVTPELCQ